VSKSSFDAAQKKLLETGLFETVAYRFEPIPGEKAYRATFEVKEIAQLFPYRFEALGNQDAAMRAWLREKAPLYRDQIPATQPVLQEMSTALEAYLEKEGRPMKVVGKLVSIAPKKMEVVFQPASLPSVAEVYFKGSKRISNPELQQTIAGTAVGSLYTENRFREILNETIRPRFEAEGLLRVSFPEISTVPAQNASGLAVTVQVNDGDVYKLRNVKLTGPMADDPRLLKEGHFPIGEVANMSRVTEGVKAMEQSLRRRGYLRIDSKIDRAVDDKDKVVDLTIDVDPGPQYRMGKLFIEGLDIQTEPHIRKLWAIKEREPFDYEYPDLFLAKMPEVLDKLGRTKSAVKPDPGTLTVDVTLIFEGQKDKPKGASTR
jgi:outer membrane protein assembly factor BamA